MHLSPGGPVEINSERDLDHVALRPQKRGCLLGTGTGWGGGGGEGGGWGGGERTKE